MSNCKTLIFLTVIICMDTDCVYQSSIILTKKPFTCFDRSRISHCNVIDNIKQFTSRVSLGGNIFVCFLLCLIDLI